MSPLEPTKRVVTTVPAHGARRQQLTALEAIVGAVHPNVATVRAVAAMPDGRISIRTAAPGGPSLETFMASRGPLSLAEAACLLHDLGHGLGFLHERGVIHGDVCAANVTITPPGVPVLVDVTVRDGHPWAARHLPPEYQAGDAPTAAGDVWALAALMSDVAGADHPTVARLLASALAEAPDRRPSARDLAASALQLGERRRLAIPAEAAREPSPGRKRATASRIYDDLRQGAPRRGSGRRRIVVTAAIIAGMALTTFGVLQLVVTAAPGQVAPEAATPQPVAEISQAEATQLLATLLAQRDAMLVAPNPTALPHIAAAGSQAAREDAALVDLIVDRGIELRGLTTEVTEIRDLQSTGDTLRIEAWTTQSTHHRREAGTWRVIPALNPRCLAYTLAPADGQWRFAQISACA